MDTERFKNSIQNTENANNNIPKHAQQRATTIKDNIQKLFNLLENKIDNWSDDDLDDVFEKIFVSNRNKNTFCLVVDLTLPIFKLFITFDDTTNTLTEECKALKNMIDCHIYSSPLGDGGEWNHFDSYQIPGFEELYYYTQDYPFSYDKKKHIDLASHSLENHYSFFGSFFNPDAKKYEIIFSIFGNDQKVNIENLSKVIETRLFDYGLKLQYKDIDHSNNREDHYVTVRFNYIVKNLQFNGD